MEQEGYVSLWIGKSESDEELLNYVETDYTEDGDCLPSQFLKDFNIDIDDILFLYNLNQSHLYQY